MPFRWLLFPAGHALRKPAASRVLRRPAAAKPKPFKENFGLLMDWLEAHDCEYPRRSGASLAERRLAKFISHQRERHKQRRLPADIVNALEGLADWSWNANASSWEVNFAAVQTWMQETVPPTVPADKLADWYPSLDPPEWIQGDQRSHEIMLAKWVHNQKYLHSKGKLSEARRTLLQGLPAWTWSSRVLGAQQEQLRKKEEVASRRRNA